MNKRILKKICKKAVPHLVSRYGFKPGEILIADREDPPHAGESLDRKHQDHARLHARGTVWRGTPFVGMETGWECREWEERTAWRQLQDCVGGDALIEVGPRDQYGCPENVMPAFQLSPINVFAWLRSGPGDSAKPSADRK